MAVPGATFELELGNASKLFPGSLLERLLGLGLEMLQNGSRKPSGATFEPGHGNASNLSPGSLDLSSKMLSFHSRSAQIKPKPYMFLRKRTTD